MISRIRNLRVRRVAIVLAVVPFMVAIFILGALAACEDFVRDDVRKAWRG